MKRCLVVLAVMVVLTGACYAQDEEPQVERERSGSTVSVAISIGMFYPLSSDTRDRLDDSLTRITVTSFETEKPTHWRFTAEASKFSFNGPTDVDVFAVSLGMEKGLSQSRNVQPYVALRAGPYWGSIEDPGRGVDESKTGLHANAALGLVFSRRFYLEGRYDLYSSLGGLDLDGLSITAGVKLFDIEF